MSDEAMTSTSRRQEITNLIGSTSRCGRGMRLPSEIFLQKYRLGWVELHLQVEDRLDAFQLTAHTLIIVQPSLAVLLVEWPIEGC